MLLAHKLTFNYHSDSAQIKLRCIADRGTPKNIV